MTPFDISAVLVGIVFGLLVCLARVLFERHLEKRAIERMRYELRMQQIKYIGQLRSLLRECGEFIAVCNDCNLTTPLKLVDQIKQLTTAVDGNGKPLERKTDALY